MYLQYDDLGKSLSGAESQSHSISSVEGSIDVPFGTSLGAGWRAEERGSDDGSGRALRPMSSAYAGVGNGAGPNSFAVIFRGRLEFTAQ